MRGLRRLLGIGSAGLPAARAAPRATWDRARLAGIDAYELVDQLPRGPARVAAWNAYALQTYGDDLVHAGGEMSYETSRLALELFSRSGSWVARALELATDAAASGARLDNRLPHFRTPLRSSEQLGAMRQTLDTLRAYVAYDLESLTLDDASRAGFEERLAKVDECVERASMLWIRRPPKEIRSGIGDALIVGLDRVFELGQALARQP